MKHYFWCALIIFAGVAIALGPCGLITTIARGEISVEAYEVMRPAEKSELGEELFGRWSSSGNVTSVSQQCHDGATRNVYRFETPVNSTASMSKTFSNPQMGTYVFSGWSKGENIVRGLDVEYYSNSLVVSVGYADGTTKEHSTLFSYGTHDWEYREVTFTANKPITSITAFIYLRAPASGVAYFDDISFRCASDESGLSTYQDLPVNVLKTATGQVTQKTLETSDGLLLGLGDNEVTQLAVDGRSIISNSFSGFLVRDIADDVNTGIFSFKPDNNSTADVFRASQPTLGLKLSADYKEKDNHISVSGKITDTSGSDEGRSVQLSYSLPVSASGWKWSTDILSEEQVSCGNTSNVYKSLGENYMDVVDWNSTARTYYPHSALYNEDLGIAIAVSMDYPQYWELEYDGSIESYVVTFHLGIVKESPDAAKFGFVIYKLDRPDYGFRSAVKKYAQIFPDYYKDYLNGHGSWLAWSDVSHIPDVEDFGFKFLEKGENYRVNGFYEEEHGIDAYYYIENGDWWISNLSATSAEDVWAKINDLASQELGDTVDDNNRPKYQALATQFCKALDQNGEIAWNPANNDWCPNGVQVHINANPALPGAYNFFSLWVNEQRNAKLFDPMVADGAVFDGYYLDELGGWWLGNANFNREHYKYTTVPLTYSPYYRRPMLHRASTTWEFVKKLSTDMHAMGKTLFANKCPMKNSFYVPLIDAMGTEQTQLSGVSYVPQSLAELSAWRTLAYTKPFSILCNNDYNYMDHDSMDKFFARCLPYAIYPDPCVNMAEGVLYWNSSNHFYERDRDVFKKYIPTLTEISEAGWEPVTLADSDDKELVIERYGDNDAEGYHFVIYNPTNRDKNISVNIELSGLNIDPECTFIETISGEPTSLVNGAYKTSLPALSSVCLCIRDPNKVIEEEEKENGQDKPADQDKPLYDNSNSGNNSMVQDNNTQTQGSSQNIIHQVGGSLSKIINHHINEQQNNFNNKTTYPWTPVLIGMDFLLTASGVILVLLNKKKSKTAKLSYVSGEK
ncbi:MAG: hypothetical protein ACI4F7_08290 [Acutalibacteraceae bacterium]